MKSLADFKKHFGPNFWRAVKSSKIPLQNLDENTLLDNLHSSISRRSYYPLKPREYLIVNKGKGVSRIVPVFHPQDYCVYFYCIKTLEDKIAYNRVPNTYGGWTLDGRLRRSEEIEVDGRARRAQNIAEAVSELTGYPVEGTFNPLAWTRMYGDFNAKLFAATQHREFKFVLEFDVANFYDSIRLDLLERKIREIANKSELEEVSLLFHFLNFWNRDNNFYDAQVVGLPQDEVADCSRILANFYLQDYDREMATASGEMEFVYFRYSDDQVIFGKNKEALEKVLFKSSKLLCKIGLNINQMKVKFFTKEDFLSYRGFDLFNKINSKDLTKVEEAIDTYLSSETLKMKNGGVPFLNKMLFTNLNRLSVDRKNKLLARMTDRNYLAAIDAKRMKIIYDYLSNEDKRRFLSLLKEISDKSLHNAYHFELRKFLTAISEDISGVQNRIEILNRAE